jgi:site-specific DNA-cytosine methylase
MVKEVKMTLTFIDLFAGMGGIRLAFEAVGAECVFSSEWDDHAQHIYQANFGDVPYGDITVYWRILNAGASFNYLLVNGKRRLTPREMLRLQGFPESYQIFGNEGQIRRLLGNSVAVPVVEAVAKAMMDALSNGRIMS